MASTALKEYRTWRRTAKPGSDFVYYISGEERPEDLFPAVYEDFASGEVALFQAPILDQASYPHHRHYAYHARFISARGYDLIAWCGKQLWRVDHELGADFHHGTDRYGNPLRRPEESGSCSEGNLTAEEPAPRS